MADDVDVALSSAEKNCNYCGSKTSKKFVKCANCGCVYHNSCVTRIKGCIQDPDGENSVICCSEKSSVKSSKKTGDINFEGNLLQTEVILLRKLVRELEEKNILLTSKEQLNTATYAEVVQLHHKHGITSKSDNIPVINKQKVLINPKRNQDCNKTIEELQTKVNSVEVQAGINKISKLKNGVVLIDLNEKDAPERLKASLSEN